MQEEELENLVPLLTRRNIRAVKLPVAHAIKGANKTIRGVSVWGIDLDQEEASHIAEGPHNLANSADANIRAADYPVGPKEVNRFMNFNHHDATDNALTVTAAHDYLRAQVAWESFIQLSSDNIDGREDKRHLLAMYDTYSRFVHHLYEFYIACIKRHRQSTAEIEANERDRILQVEVAKLMNNRAARIRRGDVPSWENSPEYYETPVPYSFAEHFRAVRNRTAHADYRRSLPESGISLADFFRQYHRYILLLFEEAHCLWNVKDVESFEWGEITAFNLVVRSGSD